MKLCDPAAALARRQFGCVARFQLQKWYSNGQIESFVRRRVLIPIERGVYVVCGGARPPEQAAMAALLRARPGARVTGPFVLGLHDVDGYTRRAPFEILTAPGRRLRGVTFRHRLDPAPTLHRASLDAFCIAAPPLAWVHSLAFLRGNELRRARVAFHSLQWRGLVDAARIDLLLDGLRGDEPGADVARKLLAEGALTGESVPEVDLGDVLRTFRPAPRAQVWVTPGIRVDWLFDDLEAVVEYFGAVDHQGQPQEEADRLRIAELEALGYLVVCVHRGDAADPAALRTRIAGILAGRAVERGVEFSLR